MIVLSPLSMDQLLKKLSSKGTVTTPNAFEAVTDGQITSAENEQHSF